MKWIVTGGNKGLGRRLVTHFGAESLSRVNGYDITQNAELIARESVKADVFVNNAFDGPPHEPWADFGQVQVLMAVYKQWREWKKTGYIINIGSVGSHYPSKPEPDFETYRVSKAALDYASAQCTYAFKHQWFVLENHTQAMLYHWMIFAHTVNGWCLLHPTQSLKKQ